MTVVSGLGGIHRTPVRAGISLPGPLEDAPPPVQGKTGVSVLGGILDAVHLRPLTSTVHLNERGQLRLPASGKAVVARHSRLPAPERSDGVGEHADRDSFFLELPDYLHLQRLGIRIIVHP